MTGNPSERPADASAARQTTAIVLASLPMGVTMFALVTWWLRRGEPAGDIGQFFPLLWMALTVSVVVAAVVVWRRMVKPEVPAAGYATTVSEDRLARLQTGLIMCMALLEGAALFGVLIWFIGGSPVPAVASVAMMWVALYFAWPRRGWYGLR